MKTADIISELANLPIDERALIADSLLQTLNPTQPSIDKAWVEIAQQRLIEISSGQVKTIPAELVLNGIGKRLSVWSWAFIPKQR